MATAFLLIVLFPLWFAAVLVGLTYPIAFWVFPGGGSRGPQDTLARRISGGLLALAMEWLATSWVIMAFPYRFFLNRGGRWRLEEGRAPVVVLPGHSENALTLFFLERRLQRALRRPVRALSPLRYCGGIERLAEEFRVQIEAWLNEVGAERVHLVGHSQGGLIARTLVERGPLRERVGCVVTLGAPHLGSVLAPLLPGRNARQMRRGSFFLEKLNSGSPADGVRVCGICSTHDNLVLPWHCGLSPRGDNFILRYRGHLTLLFSGEVVRIAAREVREAEGPE